MAVTVRILIVDDDTTLLRFLEEFLQKERYETVAADNGKKALRAFYDQRPDLVVLDVMMPGMDGWEVCARIRELADTPVIFLTAKTSEMDKLRGFRLGVDDYITKPFSLPELGARIRAILTRTVSKREGEGATYNAGALSIDLRKREARLNGVYLHLTPTEFRLLSALGKRIGEAVSQEDLIAEVWGKEHRGGGSTLRRYISLLRKKIEPHPHQPVRLVTVRGYGYRLEQ
jgi:DNA-binding response OmpR family regulator